MITRRSFIRLGLLGGIGAGLGLLRWRAGPADLPAYLRWMLRARWQQMAGGASPVAVVSCPSYQDDVLAALRQAWDHLGNPSLRGQRIVLKPNLVGYIPGPPANTQPRVLEAAIRLCREQGAREVIVAEGMAFLREPGPVLERSGVAAVLATQGVPFVDLNYDDQRQVPLPGSYSSLKTLFLPRTILEADCLISLPKLKTHHWAGVSLSLKNLFGVVPGIRYGWPKNALHLAGIPQSILDIYEAVAGSAFPSLSPALPTGDSDRRPAVWAIVDGIEGMEGDGPLYGSAVPSGALVVGRDLVAVDATCARLMGFDPQATNYLQDAQSTGLGWIDAARIAVQGVPVAALRRNYAPAPGW